MNWKMLGKASLKKVWYLAIIVAFWMFYTHDLDLLFWFVVALIVVCKYVMWKARSDLIYNLAALTIVFSFIYLSTYKSWLIFLMPIILDNPKQMFLGTSLFTLLTAYSLIREGKLSSSNLTQLESFLDQIFPLWMIALAIALEFDWEEVRLTEKEKRYKELKDRELRLIEEMNYWKVMDLLRNKLTVLRLNIGLANIPEEERSKFLEIVKKIEEAMPKVEQFFKFEKVKLRDTLTSLFKDLRLEVLVRGEDVEIVSSKDIIELLFFEIPDNTRIEIRKHDKFVVVEVEGVVPSDFQKKVAEMFGIELVQTNKGFWLKFKIEAIMNV